MTLENNKIYHNQILPIKIAIIIFTICQLFKSSNSLISQPISYGSHPNIQSHLVVLQTATSSRFRANMPFIKPKTSSPNLDFVFLSIAQMDYKVNTPLSIPLFQPYYVLNFQIVGYSTSQTQINIQFTHCPLKLTRVTLSVLVFDDNFSDRNFLSSYIYFFQRSGNMRYQQTMSTSPYAIVPFLMASDINSTISQPDLNFQLNSYYSSPKLISQVSIYGYGGFFSPSLRYKILVITQAFINTGIYQIGSYSFLAQLSNPNTFSYAIPQYSASYSEFIIGLSWMYYIANSAQWTGFVWTQSMATTPGNLDLVLDDQFNRFNYTVLIINSKVGCTNSSIPIKNTNRTNGNIQCFDECYSDQFLKWNSALNILQCLSCDPLCPTCSNLTTCKSCISGYEIAQNNSCVVSAGFYNTTGSSTAQNCSLAMTGCFACSSSASCTSCLPGYYLGTSSCVSCTTSSSFTNCAQCNSTNCLKCSGSYTLLSITACGVAPSNSGGSSAAILPCADYNCQTCNQTQLTNCSLCINPYTLQNGLCIIPTPCGNGIINSGQTCDDGNSLKYDGCSDQCQIQFGFVCTLIPSLNIGYFMSLCSYNQPIDITVEKATYLYNQNKVKLLLKNSAPQIRQWMSLTQTELYTIVDFQIDAFTNVQSPYQINYTISFKNFMLSTGGSQFNPADFQYLELEISFNVNSVSNPLPTSSLNMQNCTLQFNPFLSTKTSFNNPIVATTNHFALASSNGVLIQYNDQNELQMSKIMKFVSLILSIVAYASLALSLLSFFLQGKFSRQILITLQTVFVIQLSYFSIFKIGKLNPFYLGMIQGLKYSSGFDLQINSSDSTNLEEQNIAFLGGSTSLSNNLNISLALPTILLLIWILFYLVNNLRSQPISKTNQPQQTSQDSERKNISQANNQTKQQQPQQQQQQQSIQQNPKQKFILALSFGLFMFFLYKAMILSFIMIKQLKFALMDLIVLGVFIVLFVVFIILLILKLTQFSTFLQKIFDKNKHLQQQSQSNQLNVKYEQKQSNCCSNIPRAYIMLIILTHILNSFTIAFIAGFFQYWALIVILSYSCEIAFMLKFTPYDKANKLRTLFNYFCGIVIQVLLMIRYMLVTEVQSTVGASQSTFGTYLPYTIITILFLVTLSGLTFIIYSIQKFRCFNLEIDWQNSNTTDTMFAKIKNLKQNSKQINHQSNKSGKWKNGGLNLNIENDKQDYSLNNKGQGPLINSNLSNKKLNSNLNNLDNLETGINGNKVQGNNQSPQRLNKNKLNFDNLNGQSPNEKRLNRNLNNNSSSDYQSIESKDTTIQSANKALKSDIKTSLNKNLIDPTKRLNDISRKIGNNINQDGLNIQTDNLYSDLKGIPQTKVYRYTNNLRYMLDEEFDQI